VPDAFYEHRLLAGELGIALVRPADLLVAGDGVWIDGPQPTRVEVLWRRIDEDQLFAATGADGSPLGPGLGAAIRKHALAMANAPGNGVAWRRMKPAALSGSASRSLDPPRDGSYLIGFWQMHAAERVLCGQA
jgi:uncharacterized circularly permuted ATP-grasp superfamily protein